MSNYQKALEYAVRGYSVIPVKADKKPSLPSWKEFQEKAADDEQILKWFDGNELNVGIVTGRISGITVVDIDTKGDKVTPLDTFPSTYTVVTPSGGYHLYYQYTKDIGQTANTYPQFPHVDIRNDGGYVVAPPSITEKGSYKVFRTEMLTPFPVHLFIKEPVAKEHKSISGLIAKFSGMKKGDGRNNDLTRFVGKVLSRLNKSEYEDIGYPAVVAANKKFGEPLPQHEVDTIWKSITSKEAKKPLAEVDLLKGDKGIISNKENVYRTILNDENLRGKFRYNTFVGMIESSFEKDIFDVVQKSDFVRVGMYLMSNYSHFAKVTHADVEDAVCRAAEDFKVSPPVEYFKSLQWDGVERLSTWLTMTYNVEDSEYHRKVGSNWLKGLVKRLVYPGCKFDYVIVLEGEQGIRKSTSLAIIGSIPNHPSLHVETVFTPDSKDFFMLFSGKAIVEFSEGETLSRTDAKHLKAIITTQRDKYRAPYERAPKDYPRQCVFAMTTNQTEYLKDETGNRRWLPVACKGMVNTEWLEANREQLFAEAYHRVAVLDETVHEFPAEETSKQQEMRQIASPNEEIIFDWYFNGLTESRRNEGVTTTMAFKEGINKGSLNLYKDMTTTEGMQIGSILKHSLKLERRRLMNNYSRAYRYFPTEETKKMAPKSIKIEELTNTLDKDW